MKVNSVIMTVESVDEETGEITVQQFDVSELMAGKLTKKPASKSSSSSKSKIEENDALLLRLDDNKYTLTSGALEALDAEPGETRLVIRFQKVGKITLPVIGTNESFGIKSGNKLTLGGSVSCRGKANEELAEYGTEFILVPHPSADGIFIMTLDGKLPEGDLTVSTKKTSTKKTSAKKTEEEVPAFAQPEPEEEEELDDLDDLLADAEEVSADDFTL